MPVLRSASGAGMELISRIGGSLTAWRRTRTVTIAVAGLSRSGKTAFITSVIANLEAASRNPAAARWLTGLGVVDSARLRSAEQPRRYQPTHGRMFPFSDMLKALTAEMPSWPSRTANIYEIAVDIHFWPKRHPERTEEPTARLRLVFVDYPGEWLVDVPLLNQSYAEWSRAALDRLDRAPWSELAAEFRGVLKATPWGEEDSNTLARDAALAWQKVLLAARDRGLKWLQPGQFVRKRDQPDEAVRPSLDEEPLWFCPLPEAVIAAAKKGSLAHAMAGRYAAYQKGAAAFFGDTLKGASRHLLLVDVLEALAEGESAFHETAEVLAAVYQVFADRKSGLSRIFSRAGFDQVLLLATKADTVPPNQRAALRSLLAEMCRRRFVGATGVARPAVDYVAAIRATEDVERVMESGERVRVVQGLCSERGVMRRVDMIDIPETMPTQDYFRRREGIRAPRFVPPKVEGGARYGIPNVRLGAVLDELLGDLLR